MSNEIQEAVIRHAQKDMAASPSMWVDPPEPESTAPSTSSLMWGLWRQGLTDMQDFVLNPWQENVATNDALGTIGHPTQAQVTQDVGTVYGHHEDPHLPPIEPYEPGIEPEPEYEIGE